MFRVRRRREVDEAIDHFRNYLRVNGYSLSPSASLYLRTDVMVAKRRNVIEETLSKREKSVEDLIRGFSKLADESIRFASRERRRTVTTNDVRNAVAEVFCSVWPFCDGE